MILDVSMSITTNGMTARRRAEGTRFPGDWLLDAEGNPTDDPNAFFTDPAGTLLPLGGAEAGHKGFALGLLVEALTSGLAGHGRVEGRTDWGASVMVLVLDPARFGGAEAFRAEGAWMAEAVRRQPAAAGRRSAAAAGRCRDGASRRVRWPRACRCTRRCCRRCGSCRRATGWRCRKGERRVNSASLKRSFPLCS